MADFEYTAQTHSGQIQKGTISAHDKDGALDALRNKGLRPVVIKPKEKVGLKMNLNLPGSKVKTKDIVIFTREFATMINAGVPILRAMTILKDQAASVMFKKILEEVTSDIQGGSSLGDAMAKHPKAFSNIYVNMVKAGETGGILDDVLQRLASQQEKDAAIKGKIKGAMVYPSVIFSVTMLAFFILMTFIVPKIGTIITTLSGGTESLPIYTRILLSISHTMKSPAFIIAVVVGLPLFFIGFNYWKKTPKGRYAWHSIVLRIPVVKVIITKAAIARFARIFASLMSAGVSITDTINTTAGAIGNAVIERELLNSSKALEAGGQLSTELEKSKYFPPIVAQMLAVGEETGKTDTVILKIADFYEEEVNTAVEAISSIIEPVMIILLGGMVGLIAISVFGPITKAETAVSPSS